MDIPGVKIHREDTILIVDDDKGARETLVEMLEMNGYRCLATEDGAQAIARAKSDEVDLVMTDMHMPGLSGLDLIGEIRKIDDSIPVILITGYPSVDTAVEAMKRGAVEFLSKPFDIKLVTHIAAKALQERRLRQENRRLQADVNNAAVIEMLNRELNSKLEELTCLYSISESMNRFMDTDTIFDRIVSVASEVSGAQRISLMMLDRGRKCLTIRSSLGLPDEVVGNAKVRVGEGIAGKVAQDCLPTRVVSQLGTGSEPAPDQSGHGASSSWLSMPLVIGHQTFGVLNLTDKVGQADFSAHDEQFMGMLLEKAASKLENQALYEGIYANLIDTLNSLVTTIEAKDPYTRDHSLRVTDYALTIAQILGVNEEGLEMIDFAGTLHDIGKIGVHDEILTKAGKLTDFEYNAIKEHPLIGEKIVEPLGLSELERAIIRNHHERYDGKGYPDRISGEDIPFLARIVAVADAFDAMTTTRSYRRALSTEVATEELIRNRRTQFDPDVVDAALEALAKNLIVVPPVADIEPLEESA